MVLGSGIRKKHIPDPGSRGQKGTGSRIRIRNTACETVPNLSLPMSAFWVNLKNSLAVMGNWHRQYFATEPCPNFYFDADTDRILPLKGQCHEIFGFRFSTWISFPQAPDYTIRAVSNFLRKYTEIFAAQSAPPVSLTPVANTALWNRNYFLRFRFQVLKSYGSGSNFRKVMVLVPVPVPTFEKFPVPAPYLDHKNQNFSN
jgi:hypothetical protein